MFFSSHISFHFVESIFPPPPTLTHSDTDQAHDQSHTQLRQRIYLDYAIRPYLLCDSGGLSRNHEEHSRVDLVSKLLLIHRLLMIMQKKTEKDKLIE